MQQNYLLLAPPQHHIRHRIRMRVAAIVYIYLVTLLQSIRLVQRYVMLQIRTNGPEVFVMILAPKTRIVVVNVQIILHLLQHRPPAHQTPNLTEACPIPPVTVAEE